MFDSPDGLGTPVLIATSITVLFVVILGILLVINSLTRQRHRTRLAELAVSHLEEVNQAEREATSQTMEQFGLELHDNVGQLLSVAKMGLSISLHQPESAPERIEASIEALDKGIDELRRLGRSLNTESWNSRSLENAIEEEGRRIERIGLATVNIKRIGGDSNFDTNTKVLIFRTFQEITNNALRHSGGDTISIVLNNDAGFSMHISDNGEGFELEKIKRGAGLDNIIKRCNRIGMEARIKSTLGAGCVWEVFEADEET